ncbi:MAG: DUF5317 domain-containing protein [Clostridia bacterium]|nr:DUF5317 domain-containing protein [Clostridia bacterium]
MFIEVLILGIIVGGFQNGRLSNLTDLNIRGWYMILVALLLSLFPVFFNNISIMKDLQVYMLFASMIIILLVVLLNLDKKGAWLIFLGGAFNIILMALHNFQMPVMMSGLDTAGLTALKEGISDGSIVNYVASEATGIMTIFTKFIPIPKPYPLPKILSFGDIMMTLGLFWMIVGEMKKTNYFGKGKMVSYTYGSTFKKR